MGIIIAEPMFFSLSFLRLFSYRSRTAREKSIDIFIAKLLSVGNMPFGTDVILIGFPWLCSRFACPLR